MGCHRTSQSRNAEASAKKITSGAFASPGTAASPVLTSATLPGATDTIPAVIPCIRAREAGQCTTGRFHTPGSANSP